MAEHDHGEVFRDVMAQFRTDLRATWDRMRGQMQDIVEDLRDTVDMETPEYQTWERQHAVEREETQEEFLQFLDDRTAVDAARLARMTESPEASQAREYDAWEMSDAGVAAQEQEIAQVEQGTHALVNARRRLAARQHARQREAGQHGVARDTDGYTY